MTKNSKVQDNSIIDSIKNINITDELLENADILCYNANHSIINKKGKEVPVNPKKFPSKAIIIKFIANDIPISIYFNTKSKTWNSLVKLNNKYFSLLSPNQFEQFFNTNFYKKLIVKIQKIWPLSETFHKNLFDGIKQKQIWLSYDPINEKDEEDSKSNDQLEVFSPSGRRIVNFTDNRVLSKNSKFYCWPNLKKIYNWSTWKSYKTINPLCRLRFTYDNGHEYGISLSVVDNDFKNRGFKGYDLTSQPALQWLTKKENKSIIKLNVVQNFLKYCIKKIENFVSINPEKIYEKINNPDMITVDEIRTTQNKVRNTLNEIIKKHKVDTFKWN